MTHVSKYTMNRKIENRINNNLMNAFFTSADRGKPLLQSLLTSTEKVMLAKRFAIIVMLEKDFSYYRIEKTLKVSTSTIKRLHRRLLAGMFDPIRNAITGKRSDISFLETLEIFLSAGMPSIAGPRHAKRIRELRSRRSR
ncbi:MAG: hypothetical protein G01um10148_405 [Parcubacteria group bacterium Gr01-1014_8]|nr:MAG: hypothetical protein G01um10148_405 [Parcubacteria group bacterium Gr01-1014_8]